jgi:hypothetical protein
MQTLYKLETISMETLRELREDTRKLAVRSRKRTRNKASEQETTVLGSSWAAYRTKSRLIIPYSHQLRWREAEPSPRGSCSLLRRKAETRRRLKPRHSLSGDWTGLEL